MAKKTRYTLVFESVPHPAREINRLRMLLKAALRAYGFRCVSAFEVKDGESKVLDERAAAG